MYGWFCWVNQNKPLKAMKCLFKHLKPIACLFALLMLSQSCVVYKSEPISVEEASGYKNTKMKIVTKDGNEYKLKWIEEKDGNVALLFLLPHLLRNYTFLF